MEELYRGLRIRLSSPMAWGCRGRASAQLDGPLRTALRKHGRPVGSFQCVAAMLLRRDVSVLWLLEKGRTASAWRGRLRKAVRFASHTAPRQGVTQTSCLVRK